MSDDNCAEIIEKVHNVTEIIEKVHNDTEIIEKVHNVIEISCDKWHCSTKIIADCLSAVNHHVKTLKV